jgi:uncharacterized phage-associated protein
MRKMDDVRKIATYICGLYRGRYGKRIDEMKLHKLLYFSQRESFVINGESLFSATFKAYKYGPVLVDLRPYYKDGRLENKFFGDDISEKAKGVISSVFDIYASKDSWSLSSITHGEYSWRTARRGYAPMQACDVDIATADIAVDAKRIKQRRFLLDAYQKFLKSSHED